MNDDFDNDVENKELDQMLTRWRSKQPCAEQVANWQRAVEQELGHQQSKRKFFPDWGKMVAACLVGFLLNSLIFGIIGVNNSQLLTMRQITTEDQSTVCISNRQLASAYFVTIFR